MTDQQLNQRLGSVLATSADREQGRKNRKVNATAEDADQSHESHDENDGSVDHTAPVVANNTESPRQ